MHQPDYRDPETGAATLPWVRLHATKDYLDMAALAAEFPGVPQTFNVTPILLEQIESLAAGEADTWFDLAMKPAEELTEAESLFLVRNLFMVSWERYVDPHPRFRELLELRGRTAPDQVGPAVAARFSPQDLRDLVILFLLAWMDERWIAGDPRLGGLRDRGAPFREEDKVVLRDANAAILRRMIPEYRAYAARGIMELTCSPYFHPISPLLIDQTSAHDARPDMALPSRTFHGERDADWQLEEAVRTHRLRFGAAPTGMWPSEGSVSEASLAMAARRGIRWLGTDQEVLVESLRKGSQEIPSVAHARPWCFDTPDGPVHLLFRDHYLSDLIGFVYARWPPEQAAADFAEKVKSAGRAAGEGGGAPAHISVILDGENAWESYADDGRPFLEALYRRLSSDPEIECVLPSVYLGRYGALLPKLARVRAGSWINHDFGIWMGHQEDRRAWEHIAEARGALLAREPELPPAVFARAWRHLMAAEGSDWTWWYGTDHHTALAAEFDLLFRRQVSQIYRAAGLPAPGSLLEPIKRIVSDWGFTPPTGYLSVILDGRVSNYYEWLAAGRYEVTHAASAMHRSRTMLDAFKFGTDRSGNFFFRLDLESHREMFEHAEVLLRLAAPVEGDCTFRLDANGWQCTFVPAPSAAASSGGAIASGVVELKAACDSVFEGLIRFDPAVAANPLRRFALIVRELASGRTLEHWPPDGFLSITTPASGEFTDSWVV